MGDDDNDSIDEAVSTKNNGVCSFVHGMIIRVWVELSGCWFYLGAVDKMARQRWSLVVTDGRDKSDSAPPLYQHRALAAGREIDCRPCASIAQSAY